MWQIPLLAIGGYCALVVYELGHLLAARAFGINAAVVTIGLGPTIGRLSDGSGTILAFRVLPVRSTCGFYDGPESLKPTKPNTRPSIGAPLDSTACSHSNRGAVLKRSVRVRPVAGHPCLGSRLRRS